LTGTARLAATGTDWPRSACISVATRPPQHLGHRANFGSLAATALRLLPETAFDKVAGQNAGWHIYEAEYVSPDRLDRAVAAAAAALAGSARLFDSGLAYHLESRANVLERSLNTGGNRSPTVRPELDERSQIGERSQDSLGASEHKRDILLLLTRHDRSTGLLGSGSAWRADRTCSVRTD
jgi:hypothetical protein